MFKPFKKYPIKMSKYFTKQKTVEKMHLPTGKKYILNIIILIIISNI
jgi:hypothetical protein